MGKSQSPLKKNFGLVYAVEKGDPTGTLRDVSDDPSFKRPPTWGICRPDVRNSPHLQIGSYLVFIASYNKKLYVKGCFKVADKINVVKALGRFKKRQNVIISLYNFGLQKKIWQYEDRQTIWEKGHGTKIPKIFKSFKFNSTKYYQRKKDDHNMDNWKCTRIHNCNFKSFEKCVQAGYCIKDRTNIILKLNYIVGDRNEFYDWNQKRIEWHKVAPILKKPSTLRNGANKHPDFEFSDDEIAKLIDLMENNINSGTTT